MREKRLWHPLLALAVGSCLAACGQPAALNAPATAGPSAQQASSGSVRALDAAPGAAVTPDARTTVSSTEAVTLELLTYNTWGKPGLLGTDEKRRMELIGPAIRPFGIVALQETFTRHTRTMAKLSGFPHLKRQNNWWPLQLGSGLFTLSKYPILASDFARFKEAGDFDRFARKGVLFTRLEVPGLGEVDIYNTHYQSKQGPEFAAIRLHDNTVLEKLVRKHEKGNPTFLMGDFNMTPDSPEYEDLRTRLHTRDVFSEINFGVPGHTSTGENPHKPAGKQGKRIDYIFMLPSPRHCLHVDSSAVTFDQPVDGTVMSDHYAVRATVSIMPWTPY